MVIMTGSSLVTSTGNGCNQEEMDVIKMKSVLNINCGLLSDTRAETK